MKGSISLSLRSRNFRNDGERSFGLLLALAPPAVLIQNGLPTAALLGGDPATHNIRDSGTMRESIFATACPKFEI